MEHPGSCIPISLSKISPAGVRPNPNSKTLRHYPSALQVRKTNENPSVLRFPAHCPPSTDAYAECLFQSPHGPSRGFSSDTLLLERWPPGVSESEFRWSGTALPLLHIRFATAGRALQSH